MRFTFVDRVVELEPGAKITTLKCLSLAEEYLADHFPYFPVMPGVLMVQAMTDAATMLLHVTEGFAHSIVTLKEARNIRFADFVQPSRTLTVTCQLVSLDARDAEFKTQGLLDGRVAVSARLTLERYNLADSRAEMASVDEILKRHLKRQLAIVYQPPTPGPGDDVTLVSSPPRAHQGSVANESSPAGQNKA